MISFVYFSPAYDIEASRKAVYILRRCVAQQKSTVDSVNIRVCAFHLDLTQPCAIIYGQVDIAGGCHTPI